MKSNLSAQNKMATCEGLNLKITANKAGTVIMLRPTGPGLLTAFAAVWGRDDLLSGETITYRVHEYI